MENWIRNSAAVYPKLTGLRRLVMGSQSFKPGKIVLFKKFNESGVGPEWHLLKLLRMTKIKDQLTGFLSWFSQ